MSIIGATVRSVANRVIEVAFVQALLCGGFFIFRFWSRIAVGRGDGLGVLQVPVVLVSLPAIIWVGSKDDDCRHHLHRLGGVGGLSDAVLKPMMIGHGLEVPML
jgi:hypothetical protein